MLSFSGVGSESWDLLLHFFIRTRRGRGTPSLNRSHEVLITSIKAPKFPPYPPKGPYGFFRFRSFSLSLGIWGRAFQGVLALACGRSP